MVSLPPLRGGTGLLSVALQAVLFARSARERWILLESARGLRAPGPCAYFCRAAQVGKNALEPTVQDSLRRAGACAPLPYTGVKGLCDGFVGEAKPPNVRSYGYLI